MKEIVLIVFTFSLVTAHVTRDWSEIITARNTAPSGLQLASSGDVRVVGGNEAAPNSLPYQVGLNLTYVSRRSFCGGSLITRRHVLTAAHCLYSRVVALEVVLGAHNIRQNESTQQRIPTLNFKIHELYSNNSVENDLAMVNLPTPANLNQYVQLIALPSRADVSNSFVGSEAIASGWGYNSNSATNISDVLLYITVPVISNDDCRGTFGDFIKDSIVCSGGADRKGLCFGDSGGPLVVNRTLVGVASFIGYNGCEGGDPTGYSRVTSFLNWIAANSDAVIS